MEIRSGYARAAIRSARKRLPAGRCAASPGCHSAAAAAQAAGHEKRKPARKQQSDEGNLPGMMPPHRPGRHSRPNRARRGTGRSRRPIRRRRHCGRACGRAAAPSMNSTSAANPISRKRNDARRARKPAPKEARARRPAESAASPQGRAQNRPSAPAPSKTAAIRRTTPSSALRHGHGADAHAFDPARDRPPALRTHIRSDAARSRRASGSRPSSDTTSPPSVSTSSSGSAGCSSMPVSSLKSSRSTRASASKAPSGSALQQRAFVQIVFVVDLAHDLFDQILDGDEPVGAAIFVDHKRQMQAGGAHLEQQIHRAHRRRREQQLALDLGDGYFGPAQNAVRPQFHLRQARP